MPNDVERWLNVLPTLLGIVALLGSVVVVFRDRVRQSTIDVLTENNEALTKKIERLDSERKEEQILAEKERATTKAQMEKFETTISALERENLRLAELLQGKAEIRRLEQMIVDHNERILADRAQDRETWRVHNERLHQDLAALLGAVEGRGGQ